MVGMYNISKACLQSQTSTGLLYHLKRCGKLLRLCYLLTVTSGLFPLQMALHYFLTIDLLQRGQFHSLLLLELTKSAGSVIIQLPQSHIQPELLTMPCLFFLPSELSLVQSKWVKLSRAQPKLVVLCHSPSCCCYVLSGFKVFILLLVKIW